MAKREKNAARLRRRKALRTRRRIRVGNTRPRLSVYRSLTNIYSQIIDDHSGRTLASASSLDRTVRDSISEMNKTEVAAKIGAVLAERAKESGIRKVAFDRGPYKYHGRVKALAEAAREAGLEF